MSKLENAQDYVTDNKTTTQFQWSDLNRQCHGATVHPKYVQTWKTVCQQLIKLGVEYDTIYNLFVTQDILALYSSINFKRFFAGYFLF